ncbi:hypothetical protein B1218_31280, partial [Pseudomonas ogarae]
RLAESVSPQPGAWRSLRPTLPVPPQALPALWRVLPPPLPPCALAASFPPPAPSPAPAAPAPPHWG